MRVSELTALQVDTVLACVKIICSGVASLPLNVFEHQIKDGRNAKRKAFDHPLFNLLRGQPNPEMTSHTYRTVGQMHALLWGNAYSEIQRDGEAQPIGLWPRNPARTRPVRLTCSAVIEGTLYPKGTLIYHTSETIGDEPSFQDDNQNRMAPERIILAEDMLHVPGISLDGRLGQSTVYLARQIFGLSLASEKYAAKFFGNGAVPQGVLTTPGTLEPKAVETLRRSWSEAHGGENAHKTAILEQGLEYKPIGIDPQKSQFLETRHYQRAAIASIFQVPLHMIGEKEAAKSSVEQTSIEFYNYCLGPWLNAWEQEFKRKLFPVEKKETEKFFVRFDIQRLLYPDAASRSKFYTDGKNTGWLNSNDIREMEDMNPIEDGSGDVYWMPVNMQDAANPLTAPHIGGAQNIVPALKSPEKPQGGAPQNLNKPLPKAIPQAAPTKHSLVQKYEGIYRPLFQDATGRVRARKDLDQTVFNRCFRPAVESLIVAIATEQKIEVKLNGEVDAYLEGMRSNLKDAGADYAEKETKRAVETFTGIIEKRSQPKPFYIGRHGTTDDDVNGVWTGWADEGLNEVGISEVKAAAEKLKALGIKRIVSSPLVRAVETARIYATVLGIPLELDQDLSALNLGVFAGLNEKENAHRLELYVKNPTSVIPDGESVKSYQDRIISADEKYQEENAATGPILVLTHSSSIAVILAKIRTGDSSSEDLVACGELLSPAGVVEIDDAKVTVITGKLSGGDAA